MQLSLPLNIAIKLLDYAKTSREIKFILNSGKVKVNNKVVKEPRLAISLFDVISFPQIKKYFRVMIKNKKLFLHEIREEETKIKPAKVINSITLKGSKRQINLDDGRNFLSAEKYSVGNTVIFNLESKKVDSQLKLEKGNLAYLLSGKHLGRVAKIVDIDAGSIICELDSEKINVLKKHVFIIGKDKPIISLPEE